MYTLYDIVIFIADATTYATICEKMHINNFLTESNILLTETKINRTKNEFQNWPLGHPT